MADYLEKETGCKTIMIGIQPASILYGDELSEPVASTVRKITKIMMKNIKKLSDQFQKG
jgi:Ni,Fe-hydrogenase maturation factor